MVFLVETTGVVAEMHVEHLGPALNEIHWCVRSGVAVVQRPWPLVNGNGFIPVSERAHGFVSVLWA
jgi:hypothetical protein